MTVERNARPLGMSPLRDYDSRGEIRRARHFVLPLIYVTPKEQGVMTASLT